MSRTVPDSRSPKEVWDEQHRLLAESPVAWVGNADSLIRAFETLIDEEYRSAADGRDLPRLSNVAYMVAGFAIEVLLKGLLVQQKPPVNSNGRFKLDSHRLVDLARAAGFTLNEGEPELLDRLEEYLTWAGRYPIPLTSDPMRPRLDDASGGFAPITYHNRGVDWPGVRELFVRLKRHLPNVRYDESGV